MAKDVREMIDKVKNYKDCVPIKITDEIIAEVNKFNTPEELLRSGGISIEALDRAAHGFSEEDIKTIDPNKLHIKWKDDLDNVKHEIRNYHREVGGSLQKAIIQWVKKVDLSEPIDVSFEKNKFYLEDGHHRYFAAKILKKPLNVNLVIKMNPIVKLAPTLSYDDFHKCIFKQVKKLSQ
jgi:hypothetical protein